MLYDRSRTGNAQEGWLSPHWWARRGAVRPAGAGRGSAWLIDAGQRALVLRHYRRGGLMAQLSEDRYWWRGADATRSFCEFRLLYHLRRAGLPVPQPIAAGFHRLGSRYTADILIERLPDTRTLIERLREAPLQFSQWVALGRCIRRFVTAGVHHADLNAHNVLLDAQDRIWLIDFDRARARRPGLWSDAMLARLYGSLRKECAALPAERFTPADWHSLLDAYLSDAAAAGARPAGGGPGR
jgi:3-deoxy-D-manno-octulosonic acid kinase